MFDVPMLYCVSTYEDTQSDIPTSVFHDLEYSKAEQLAERQLELGLEVVLTPELDCMPVPF